MISSLIHPHYKEVIRTYLDGMDVQVVEIPYTAAGCLDRKFIQEKISQDSACAALSFPNFLGIVENYEDIAETVHAAGGLLIVNVNPMSLSYFTSPREWGADIVTGEGQPFGIPMSWGGPLLGFFAATKVLMRKIPGRIAGLTKDTEGKRAFVLTLQAREQHIRREKAASNICTNQGLMALAATIYLSLMGESGLKRVNEINISNSLYLKEAISKLKKFQIPFEGAIFNEFAVRYDGDVKELLDKLEKKKVFGGINLEQFDINLPNHFLVCVTETKTRDDLDAFIKLLGEAAS